MAVVKSSRSPSFSGNRQVDVKPMAIIDSGIKLNTDGYEDVNFKEEATNDAKDNVTESSSEPNSKSKNKPTHIRQLFLDSPSKLEQVLKTFEVLTECTYGNKFLGDAGQDEVMTCDCKESWDGKRNAACDEDSDCINRMTSMECIDGDCNCGDGCRNQRFQRKEYAPIDIFQTDMKGYGVRAQDYIHQGTFIYEYIGEVIDEGRFRKRMVQYDEQGIKHFYFMMLQQGEFVDATQKGCLARFCNHSCNPNCFVDKWVVNNKLRMGIFAKRDIVRGEEITFDYNVDRYGAQAQPCYCGEPNCIGFIGGKTQTEAASKLPQALADALGISDDESDWTAVAPKRKRKAAKTGENDEDYVSTLPTRSVKVEGVSKIMSSLLQVKEKWLVSKLLKRIHMSDDQNVQRRVMQMHGYQILGTLLRDWATEDDIIILVLEILSKWPRITKNKISSSRIESTVADLQTNSSSERIKTLAQELTSSWQNLEMAYRIPRRERPAVPEPVPESEPDKENDKEKEDEKPKSTPKSRPLLNGKRPGDSPFNRSNGTKPHQKLNRPKRNPRVISSTNQTPLSGPRKLPPNWVSYVDANQSGEMYYYNTLTRAVQWEFPGDAIPAPPPPPANATAATAVSGNSQEPERHYLQKIIDEANRKSQERAKDEVRATASAKATTISKEKRHRAEPSARLGKKEDDDVEAKLTRLFAKYIPNIVARYEEQVGHDKVKKYSKEITKLLVAKELRPDHVVKSTTELSDEKKKKIKAFVKMFMDKVLSHKSAI
ncbi:uncharacterized protein V1516DRAFT_669422 [Lipomyces oligophaga]|uniref:uncharacterized protein n=1 Tax=Lipomyces oligophaga TaxID=45792 RepID=UPI0034CFB21A